MGRHATAHSEYKVGFSRERAQQRFGKDNMDAPSFDLLPGWTFVDDGVGYYKHTNGTVQSKRPRRDLSKQRATLGQLLEQCANMYIATRSGYKYDDFVPSSSRKKRSRLIALEKARQKRLEEERLEREPVHYA